MIGTNGVGNFDDVVAINIDHWESRVNSYTKLLAEAQEELAKWKEKMSTPRKCK